MRYTCKVRWSRVAHWSLVVGSMVLPGLHAPQTAHAAQVTTSWIGPGGLGGDGNWGVASNWSGNVVPINGSPAGTTYNVIIDGSGPGAVVTLSDGHATVDALTTSVGDTLEIRWINAGTSLKVVNTGPGTGTITNAGTILMSGEVQTDLLLNGEVTLTGGGRVRMVNQSPTNAGNSIRSLQAGARLINVNNTISGAGNIGSGELALTNQATITADASPGLRIYGPNFTAHINTGTLRAIDGSTLTIGATINNAGGIVRVDSSNGNSIVHLRPGVIIGGTVELIGVGAGELQLDNPNTGASSISGGTVTNNATGTIRNIQRTNTLSGVVTNPAGGQIIIDDTSTLVLPGGAGNSYQNAGNIALNATASSATLRINGEVTLTGGGTVTMSNHAGNSIQSTILNSRFINADNAISGAGSIGSGMALTNQATITANASAGLKISASTSFGTNFNTGTLRAIGGNMLTIGTTIDNTGGLVRVDSSAGDSIVHLIRGVIVGGTTDLIGAGAGELRLDNQNTGASSISGGRVTNNTTGTIRNIQRTNSLSGIVTNPAGGQIIINDASILILTGGAGNRYRNSGNIALNATASSATLRIEGEVTLTGGGTVTMSNHAGNGIKSTVLNARLINANNTISGAGSIGDVMAFTNRGTLRADQTTSLIVNVFPSATGFTTSGRVQVIAGSVLAMGSGDIFTQTAGTTVVDGTLALAGGAPVALQGGFLKGSGVVSGPINNSGGKVAPGLSPGVLSETGNYIQGAGGALRIELNGATPGTEYDQFNVTGTVSLNGRLVVTSPFDSPAGTAFSILNNDGADAVSGTFTNLPEGATLRVGSKLFRISYSGGDGNDVILTRVRPTLSISDATVIEGDTGTKNIIFTVTLSEAVSQIIQVNYATVDFIATAPADYIAATDTLTFAAGKTTRIIVIAVQGDTVDEVDERFRVQLSTPILASLADAVAVGTITDDDEPSTPEA